MQTGQHIEPGTRLVLTQRLKDNELVAEECRSLTGVAPEEDIAWGAETRFIGRGAFLGQAMEVIASGHDLASLCEETRERTSGMDLTGFRITIVNRTDRDVTIPDHVVPLADAIPWYPDLTHPRFELALLVTDTHWLLTCIVDEIDRGYRIHDGKPGRTSYSMPTQLARAMVNLLPRTSRSILDPCCGTGSLPLEALSLGFQVSCGDLNPNLVQMTNENLAHFGYEPCAVEQDARSWHGHFDAVITDVPYGRYNHTREAGEQLTREILSTLPALAPLAIIVAEVDFSDVLRTVGFSDVAAFRVVKFTGLTRYVHRASLGALES